MVIFDLYILLLNTITRIKPQKYGYSFIYLCIYLNGVLLGFFIFYFLGGGRRRGLIRLRSTKKKLNSFLRFNGWIQNYGTFFSHTQEFYNSIGRLIFSADMSRVIIPSFAVN